MNRLGEFDKKYYLQYYKYQHQLKFYVGSFLCSLIVHKAVRKLFIFTLFYFVDICEKCDDFEY